MFYVYEWYDLDNDIIFYVGKGCNNRYLHTRKRNNLFKDYYKTHNCSSRIIKEFEDEYSALEYEHTRICELKATGQCFCNLDDGGTGGTQFMWTPEMREYKSKYNPMKSQKQKERMIKNNPMHNLEVAKKNGEKHKKPIIINGKYFTCSADASKAFGVTVASIIRWCKRGYDTFGNPCRYANKEQKPYSRKITCSKPVIIDGITYSSVKEGARAINVCSENLIRAIKNNRKCKGHICQYDNQHPSQRKSDNRTLEGSTTNE